MEAKDGATMEGEIHFTPMPMLFTLSPESILASPNAIRARL
jgi:hypothetical protein